MAKVKDSKAGILIGTPEKLINQLIKDPQERAWALGQITQEGPPHKQAQHTLVLKRLEKLMAAYKKSGLLDVRHLTGESVSLEHYGPEAILPVHIPKQSLSGIQEGDKVLEALSKGPEHEMLYTALLLQVIEALIEAAPGKA